MKISVDVDCTPEEARRFMGLPDLTSVHEAYLSRMKTAIDQSGITPDAIHALVQSWAPMGEASLNVWRHILDNMGGSSQSK